MASLSVLSRLVIMVLLLSDGKGAGSVDRAIIKIE